MGEDQVKKDTTQELLRMMSEILLSNGQLSHIAQQCDGLVAHFVDGSSTFYAITIGDLNAIYAVNKIIGAEDRSTEEKAPQSGERVTEAKRAEHFEAFIGGMRGVMVAKNADYSAGMAKEDGLANFNEVARLLKGAPITPYTVAMIYFLKHVFSIIKFCKTGTQESGEALGGRHTDLGNYSFFLNELAGAHQKWVQNEQRQRAAEIQEKLDAQRAMNEKEMLEAHHMPGVKWPDAFTSRRPLAGDPNVLAGEPGQADKAA